MGCLSQRRSNLIKQRGPRTIPNFCFQPGAACHTSLPSPSPEIDHGSAAGPNWPWCPATSPWVAVYQPLGAATFPRASQGLRGELWADVALVEGGSPLAEGGRALRAETRAPAQLGLGEVPANTEPAALLWPKRPSSYSGTTGGAAAGMMELDRWAQLGLAFLQLLLISSLPRGTVSDWEPSWGLMGSHTRLGAVAVIIWGVRW